MTPPGLHIPPAHASSNVTAFDFVCAHMALGPSLHVSVNSNSPIWRLSLLGDNFLSELAAIFET